MKSREHVTTNGRAVFFAAMWEDLKSAAISHGWALGLHGSLVNDMDIMAMAWDEHASTPEAMIEQLCICFSESSEIMNKMRVTTDMPNNRVVYTLPIWADFYLDINVISSQFTRPSVVTQSAEEILMKHIPKDCYWEEMGNLTNTPKEYVLKAMQEYSLLERSRAIDECKAKLTEVWLYPDDLDLMLSELEKLKSRQ